MVIVGAGAVGSTFAYALAKGGLSDEIVLLDKNHDLMEGQVLDLAHGLPFLPAVHIRTGRTSDYADARVIVLTAGANQKPGESRLSLLRRNAGIVEGIVEEVRNSAYHIIDYKGATYYAIGLALVRIIESILHNRRSVLTVSTLLQGEYGVENICLGVPALITQNGVEKVLEASLLPDEQKALLYSASVLKKAVTELQQS